jgi:hypothetical protein
VKPLWIAVAAIIVLGAGCPKQSITIVPSTERKQGVPDLGDMSWFTDDTSPEE